MNFIRPHHKCIGRVLKILNANLLKEHHCLFGGGTAIALKYGEYRESVDIVFLVSDLSAYRVLRNLVRGGNGIAAIMTDVREGVFQLSDVRADQYGIRTKISVAGQSIKFEIVLEGRISLGRPGKRDEILGVATLTQLDMAVSKLLANSDRWADVGVHCRDVIDLAMMNLNKPVLQKAVEKAETAYGEAILIDLTRAVDQIQERDGLLEKCMTAMDVCVPRDLLWQNIHKLRKVMNE